MRLYPKQINSIEELRLEKQKLLDVSKKTDIRHILSLDDIFSKKKRSEKEVTDDEGNSSSMAEGLLKEDSIAATVISLAMPFLQKTGTKIGSVGKDIGKKVVVSVAKEVLGGYLKWKAVEWSLKGLLHFIKSRKKNKDDQS